jgi:hypothetical protein
MKSRFTEEPAGDIPENLTDIMQADPFSIKENGSYASRVPAIAPEINMVMVFFIMC